MRIRKNAKLSTVLSSHGWPAEAPLPLRVCPLNQSPWDVIPFSFPDALAPSSSLAPRDGGEESFTTKGSLGDSIGAIESSMASMMTVDAEENTVIDHKLKGHAFSDNNNRTGSKGWRRKDEAGDGNYLGKHHLLPLPCITSIADEATANADDSASGKLDKPSASTGPRSGRLRGANNSSSSIAVNSNQFFYYSGFGPSWGKRRRGRAGGNPQPTPPWISCEESDYVDSDTDEDEDDEDYDDRASRKKRMRKPVKARSVKSLM
ncbi:hypothetical protein BT93_I0619 [Corymbia citriodora subsp. variegata]|nr:hypothetical protein BT93_I0619 [Corymbia citriodora subsp. variegata]